MARSNTRQTMPVAARRERWRSLVRTSIAGSNHALFCRSWSGSCLLALQEQPVRAPRVSRACLTAISHLAHAANITPLVVTALEARGCCQDNTLRCYLGVMDNWRIHVARALVLAGSQHKLAKAAGVSQTSIYKLLHQAKRPSADMAVAIEHATAGGVTRQQLRPDLFRPCECRVVSVSEMPLLCPASFGPLRLGELRPEVVRPIFVVIERCERHVFGDLTVTPRRSFFTTCLFMPSKRAQSPRLVPDRSACEVCRTVHPRAATKWR